MPLSSSASTFRNGGTNVWLLHNDIKQKAARCKLHRGGSLHAQQTHSSLRNVTHYLHISGGDSWKIHPRFLAPFVQLGKRWGGGGTGETDLVRRTTIFTTGAVCGIARSHCVRKTRACTATSPACFAPLFFFCFQKGS